MILIVLPGWQLGRSGPTRLRRPLCGMFRGVRRGYRIGQLTATNSAPRTLCAVIDVRQVVMTLSEYERRTLDGVENNCRREDPAFADRMNLTAAGQRSSRSVVMAQCAT